MQRKIRVQIPKLIPQEAPEYGHQDDQRQLHLVRRDDVELSALLKGRRRPSIKAPSGLGLLIEEIKDVDGPCGLSYSPSMRKGLLPPIVDISIFYFLFEDADAGPTGRG
jgi:hypothetical protein